MILTYNNIKEPYETRKGAKFCPIVLLFDVGGQKIENVLASKQKKTKNFQCVIKDSPYVPGNILFL